MQRRVARIVLNLTVELTAGGQTIRAVSQDVTPFGMFIRMGTPLPVGSVVELAIAPSGARLTTTATVVHSLTETEARALGRKPGIGVVFRDALRNQADLEFQAEIIKMIETNPQHDPASDELRIVVADPQTRLLERLSTALGHAGFTVYTATNGMEALGAVLSREPDVVLAERDMPVMDGLRLLEEMGRQPELAAIPVILMSENATDLVRLQALQLGAVDCLPKPFTTLEVVLRARRLGRVGRREGERVLLRGAVEQLGLPSLLTMLEQERKTGVLRLTRDETVAWLSFVDGRLVRARASDKRDDSRATLMRILDWTAGHFELSAGSADGDPELDDSVTHLLLEHARVTDEARARS
ncbi:MAG: response regulator [Deltaproteobacteria bacterium]|nr:response regulator [Kofleriaceae bacterium]